MSATSGPSRPRRSPPPRRLAIERSSVKTKSSCCSRRTITDRPVAAARSGPVRRSRIVRTDPAWSPRYLTRDLGLVARAATISQDHLQLSSAWSCVPSELLEGGVAKHQPLDPSAAKVDLGLRLVARASQPDHRAEAPRVVRDAITRL